MNTQPKPKPTQSEPEFFRPTIQPPSVLLLGGPGDGKTYSLVTLAKAGLEVFVIVTEPVGLDTLIDVFTAHNLLHKLHWVQINPSRTGFSDLAKAATLISSMTYEGLAKMTPTGDRRSSKWHTLLTTLANFKCERTGTVYGSVETLSPNCALVIDSLSGLNIMAMDLVIGDKPNAHQGEWGIAMGVLERLILSLTSQLRCPFVLTAHLEKETNEITGATQVMASALGKKLPQKLPRFFSEVVMAYRNNDKFLWTNTANGVSLKNRSLPLSNELSPDFAPIIHAYRERMAAAQKSVIPLDVAGKFEGAQL